MLNSMKPVQKAPRAEYITTMGEFDKRGCHSKVEIYCLALLPDGQRFFDNYKKARTLPWTAKAKTSPKPLDYGAVSV